jgi:tetratricopeptide (TPR) repeat protein
MRENSLSGSSSSSQGVLTPLPPELQKTVDAFHNWLIDIEKKYYHSDLVPFKQHAEEMKAKGNQIIADERKQFQRAEALIKEHFERQEKENPGAFAEATYSIWEEAADKMRKQITDEDFLPSIFVPLQEQMSLPWPWMDRVYRLAGELLEVQHYEEAQDIYVLLYHLQPAVFEYCFGVATCQHMLGKYQDAVNTYSLSLLLQPENALVFFQMADCFFKGQEQQCGMQTLEYCIEYAQKDDQYKELYQEAVQLKQSLGL